MPAQNIIGLGFDAPKVDKEAQQIIASMREIYAEAKKLEGLKISFTDFSGGIKQFKDASEQLAQVEKRLSQETTNHEKVLQQLAKTREANAKATKAEVQADSEVIKQIGIEADAEKKLAQAKLNTAKAQQQKADAAAANIPVPFTTNVNPDGTINEPALGVTTGTIVTDEELAATKEQLALQAELNAEKKELSQIDLQSSAAITTYTTALQQEVAALLEDEAALAANKVQQKELQTAMIAGGGATAVQTEQMVALKTEQFALNQSIADTRGNVKNLTKEFLSEEGSINELRAQVQRLTTQYEALSVAERESQFGVNLKKQISVLQPALLQAEGELGKFQRNVGNYSGGITKAFGSIFSSVRQIAYILPGIGIAGIFSLAFEAISKFATSLFNSTKQLDQFKESSETLKTVMSDSNGEYAKAIENVDTLRINIDLAKEGFLKKDDVVKQYNETIGKTTGEVKTLNEAEAALIKNADAYIKFTLYKAAATASLSKAADEAVKAAEQQREDEQRISKQALNDTKKNRDAEEKGLDEFLKHTAKNELDADKKTGEQRVKTYTDIAEEFQKNAAQIAKDNKFNFFPDKPTAKKQAGDAFAVLKDELSYQIKQLQDFVNNGSVLFKERFEAAKEEAAKEIQLSETILKSEIAAGKNRVLSEQQNAHRIEEINQKLSDNLTKINQDRAKNPFPEQEIIAPVDNTQEELQKQIEAQKKVNDELKRIIENAAKDRANLIATEFSDEQTILNDKYAQGLINREDFEKGKRDLAIKYGRETLEASIHIAEQQLLIEKQANPNSDKVRELTAEIAKLKVQLSEFGVQAKDNTFKDLGDQLQNIADITQNLTQAFTALGDVSFDNQIAGLQEIQAQEEKNYEQEVANINNSTLSQEDKANKLKVLDAQHTADQEKLQREQRKYDNEKAKFDRDAAILNIIAGTLASAAKAGWITPIAIAIEIAGAAGLVKALATKIPSYKQGLKGNKPGHIGIYGEAGDELIEKPNEHPFIADTATLDYLPSGTRITPLSGDEINKFLYDGMRRNTGNVIRQPKEKRNASEIDYNKLEKIMRRSFQKQKRPVVHNHIGKEIDFLNWVNKNVRGK